MYSKNLSGGGSIDSSRPYVSPALEVVGVELQKCVMAGSGVTESLTYEDFSWE